MHVEDYEGVALIIYWRSKILADVIRACSLATCIS